jgi:hypothetical protein
VLLFVSLVGFGWGLSGTRFEVGEAITFEVQDSTTWFWGCCCNCCEETMILGWRIANTSEQTLYSVVLDTPAYASTWQGVWNQLDAGGVAVAAGQYKLYVDTSAGTLSRCFSIYDRCACNCYSPCSACACADVSSITNCACKVSLVFVDNCSVGCFPLFWWSGCCGSSCSGCGCP